MLRSVFIGRNPSHFQINPFVKAFLISESLVLSGFNFIIPIIAIFIIKNISNGTVEIAAFAFSIYLITRILTELVMGKFLVGSSDRFKLKVTISGIILTSLGYIVFSLCNTILQLFTAYIIAGIGLGIAAPAKYSIFSTHLDKGREPAEWSAHDVFIFSGSALATALGGVIAALYGFQVLFIVASTINVLGTIPYLLFFKKRKIIKVQESLKNL